MSSDHHLPLDARQRLKTSNEAARPDDRDRSSADAPGGNKQPDSLIDRVEREIGAPLFAISQGDVALTDVGRHLLTMAHRILAENDKRAKRSDTTGEGGRVRIGISSMLLNFLTDHPAMAALSDASVTSDICSKITTAFEDDDVDVAMVLDAGDHRARLQSHLVGDFGIEFAWMKVASMALDAKVAIPLATWPPDQHIVLNDLSAARRAYRVMFTGPDYTSKFTAVRSGQCVAVVPKHAIAPPFVEADEAHLPPITPKRILLAVRGDPHAKRFAAIVSALSSFPLAGAAASPS